MAKQQKQKSKPAETPEWVPDENGNYEIGPELFEIFKKTASTWLDILNLNDFKVYFQQEQMEDYEASCDSNLPSMIAMLSLNTHWPYPPSKKAVSRAARHEVIELLLQPIWHAVLARCLNVDWANAQRHAAVRRLEDLLERVELITDKQISR